MGEFRVLQITASFTITDGMASHHSTGCHHHHTTACCGCYSHLPPPPTCSCCSTVVGADPLLHTIALHLLQSTPPSQLPQSYQYQYQHHLPPQPPLQQHGNHFPDHSVDSLVQRIAALESTLTSPVPHYAYQKPVPEQKPQIPTQSSSKSVDFTPPIRLSLRDVAARTIQTRFRIYLVRRSRTLRHLKQLSVIRFQLGSLDPTNPISERVMELLVGVDSIQSRDPLIRDLKKSISNELLTILKRRELICVESAGVTTTGTAEAVEEVEEEEGKKKGGYNPQQLGLRPPLPFKMI